MRQAVRFRVAPRLCATTACLVHEQRMPGTPLKASQVANVPRGPACHAVREGADGLGTYGFLVLPVGLGWTIAAGVVALR